MLCRYFHPLKKIEARENSSFYFFNPWIQQERLDSPSYIPHLKKPEFHLCTTSLITLNLDKSSTRRRESFLLISISIPRIKNLSTLKSISFLCTNNRTQFFHKVCSNINNINVFCRKTFFLVLKQSSVNSRAVKLL